MMKTLILRWSSEIGARLRQLRVLGTRDFWTSRQTRARALAAAATLVTLAVPTYVFVIFNDPMRHSGGWGDEGYFVWCGWSLLKGLVPYRDFMEFKPPFVFLTYALALKLHGLGDFGYRRFFLYFPLASILALQVALLTRRVDRWLAMGLSLALIHLWVTKVFHDYALSDTESIGLTYYFLGTAVLLARTRFVRLAPALGTALLICCTQSKDPFLMCVVPTWAACFLAAERVGTWRQDAVPYVKWSFVGGAVVVLGLCVYMIPTGAMSAYIRMVKRYAVIYRDPVQSFCVAGGVFKPTTPLNDLWRQAQALGHDYANLTTMGFLLPFAAGFFIFARRRSLPMLALALAALVASILAVAASNCPWKHYYNMLLGGLFFVLAVGLDAMTAQLSAIPASMRWVVRVAMLTSLGLTIWPRVEAEAHAYGTRTFQSPLQEPGPRVFELIRANTTPADRIVTNGNPILYVQVDRISGVRESNFLDPILGYYVGATDKEKLRPVYEEMEKSRPKIVILDSSFMYARGRHHWALFAPYLADHHYKQLTDNVYLRPD
jgi:hypothetical protein